MARKAKSKPKYKPKTLNLDTIAISVDKFMSNHPILGPSYRKNKVLKDMVDNPRKYRK